jgi:hypothetical protein
MPLIIAAWTGVVWSVLSVIIFGVSILTIGVILHACD